MQKQESNKLSFSKEKIADLSAADLEQVVGGQEQATTEPSTYRRFTCNLCTSIEAHVEW